MTEMLVAVIGLISFIMFALLCVNVSTMRKDIRGMAKYIAEQQRKQNQ